MWTLLSWEEKTSVSRLVFVFLVSVGGDSGYLSEGDGDAGVQLDVIGQLRELVLLLLKSLQQTVDLLLRQHHSAVVLRRKTTR